MSPDPPFTAVQIYLNAHRMRLLFWVGLPALLAVIGLVSVIVWLAHLGHGRREEAALSAPSFAVAQLALPSTPALRSERP